MELKKYQIINVQAYKHNSHLYRQWNGVIVVDITNDYVLLAMPQTKVIAIFGQQWKIKEPMMWYFPRKNKFYNATVLVRKSGYHIYTNLASPFYYEDNCIKFIDYDLDIKNYPNTQVSVVDVEEHKRNIIKYRYPKSIINKIEKTTNEILELIKNNEFIYNQELTKNYYKSLVKDNQFKKKLDT